MTSRERFLKALHRQQTDRPCAGNCVSAVTTHLMAASGCRFPEAHLDPAVMAGLAATAPDLLGYDTIAPVFSVQHEAAALGCEVDWGREDMMPDATTHPWRRADDITIPADFLDHPAIVVVLEALKRLRQDYPEVALIGKVMGPWTLAYHLFGVQRFLIMTIDDPAEVARVLRGLLPVTVEFAQAQFAAGADAVTLADHATGDLVSGAMYREMLWPLHCEIGRSELAPIILHICGNTADRIEAIAQTGFACFHFESKVPATTARALAGEKMALMGNLNNPQLLLQGTPAEVRQAAREAREAGVDIVAPECAVPLTTPTENLRSIVP